MTGRGKVIFKFFSNCCFKRVWPGSELLIWYVVCFQAMSFRDTQQWRIEAGASVIYLFSNYRRYNSTTTMPMTTKLGKMITYLDGLLTKEVHEHLISWSCSMMWSTKTIIIFYIRVLIATKLGRMVTYLERLLTIKSFNTLMSRSCKVTWQMKTIISPLLECL